MNLLLPGMCQIVHGQVAKGLAILVVGIFAYAAIIPGLIVAAVSTADAYMVGSALRKGKPMGKWRFFPT